MRDVYIKSLSHWHPDRAITNSMLSMSLDTDDDWIVSRTGIKERRAFCAYSETPCSDAAKMVLGNYEGMPIDAVFSGGCVDDGDFPTVADNISGHLGLTVPCYQVKSACTTALKCIGLARSMVMSEQVDDALVVIPELLTLSFDYSDRSTCILAGDGVGACMVSSSPGGYKVLGHRSGGRPSDQIGTGVSGARPRVNVHEFMGAPQMRGGYGKFWQNGQAVYKFVTNTVPRTVRPFLEEHGLGPSDIDVFVQHQANLLMQEKVCRKLGVPERSHFTNIEMFGNQGAAGVLTAFSMAHPSISPGSKVLLAVFGAGLSWSLSLLERCDESV